MKKIVISFLILFIFVVTLFHSCTYDIGQPVKPPFTHREIEGFENDTKLPAGWAQYNPDGDASWEVVSNIAHTGNHCVGFNNCSGNGNADMSGRRDALISPSYDFSEATTVSLSFDIAYAVLNFKNQLYPDSLTIFSSIDGGNTWKKIYLNGGEGLSNIPPITTSPPCWLPSVENEWRTDFISLNNLAGQPNVKFQFENHSAWGEWMCIDNITVTSSNGSSDCEKITYSKDIEPIMKTNCATKGCHVPNGASPDLTIFQGAKESADNGQLKKRMIDGNPSFMPSSGKLSDTDLEKVACWINAGAPNN